MSFDYILYSNYERQVEALIDGAGPTLHRLPYVKTDCAGSFEVANNSLAKAAVRLLQRGGLAEEFETTTGAVLEWQVGVDRLCPCHR